MRCSQLRLDLHTMQIKRDWSWTCPPPIDWRTGIWVQTGLIFPILLVASHFIYFNSCSELCPESGHLCSHSLKTSMGTNLHKIFWSSSETHQFTGSSCLVSAAPGRCNTGLSALTQLNTTHCAVYPCAYSRCVCYCTCDMCSTGNVRTFLESQGNLAGPHNFKKCGFKMG